MLLISDVHGCYYTLMRLLAKSGCKNEDVVLLGDLIDRGPHSNLVLKFAMDNKIRTVAGNHEDMFVDSFEAPAGQRSWLSTGAAATVRSFGGSIPVEVVEWMKALPVFLQYDDLLLSHTGHGLHPNRWSSTQDRSTDFPDDGLFRVFGHTPHMTVVRGPRAWNIDTGAAYVDNGYGTLSALEWPSLRIFTQRYDERPFSPTAG